MTITNNGTKREITAISLSGFKSLADEYEIAIRPLTILAGANSSGKSSMIQPLLMGLTNQIDAQKVNDVEFEIRVGQLPLSAT